MNGSFIPAASLATSPSASGPNWSGRRSSRGSGTLARRAGALRTIAMQSDKLNRLLGHLLDISRLESGRLELERQPTDIPALVAQVVADARARGDRHAITLTAAPGLEADVDPLRLEQVLINLLDNAIKYSPDCGAIEVDVSRTTDDALEIAVRDHGLGIPPERRGRI